MTTLQAFGGRSFLCFPKPRLYRFFLLLVGCFISSLAMAQQVFTGDYLPDTIKTDAILKMPTDTIPDTVYIADCGLDIQFQSDMTPGGVLYKDIFANRPRNSIVTICPPDASNHLLFSFDHFDLEAGDTLCVYEGIVTHYNIASGFGPGATPPLTGGGLATGSGSSMGGGPLTGSGSNPAFPTFDPLILVTKHSGYGASNFNGGWVGASCDQTINTSGCLTFHFKTDGNLDKATGWNAYLSCRDRTTSLMPPDNQFHSLSCAEVKTEITVGAGKILTTIDTSGINGQLALSDCTINNDTIRVKIFNGAGVLCKDTCLRADSTFMMDTLAIGTYTVKHYLKSDTTIAAESYIAISPPVMVCNDDLNISLDASCGVSLAPDDILENPCEILAPYTSYEIKVTMGSGDKKIEMVGSTTTSNTTSISTPIIWIPRDSMDKAGVSHCGGKAQVEIKRIYDYGTTCCSQGIIEDVCWGSLTFQDETAPIVYKVTKDTVKACNLELANLEPLLGKPIVVDNCDSVTVKLVEIDIVTGTKCDTLSKYASVWRAEDECGNQTIYRDTLYVLRPTAADIVKLPDVILSCGVDEEKAIQDLSITGIPKFALTNDTLELNTETYTCDFILLKRDEYFPHPGGIKLFRFWSLSDRCSPRPIPIPVDTQLIEFVDTLIPTLICPSNGMLETADKFPIGAFDCATSVTIENPPAAHDLCDTDPTVHMIVVEQLNHGKWDSIAPNLGVAGDLTADTFRVGWHAFDETLNFAKDTCHSYFILEDLTPPSAICKDKLNVSFGTEDQTLTVDDVDDISWDACGVANREIRITGDTLWGKEVTITCEDVYDPIRVELRVTDVTGNQNICWLFVEVIDNVPPVCNELRDTFAFCDEFHTGDLGPDTDADGDGRMEDSEWLPLTDSLLFLYNSQYGIPTCQDNATCRVFFIEQEYQLIYTQCGEANFRRRYRAVDLKQTAQITPWEEQRIAIQYRPNWKFTLPIDWAGECGDDLPSATVDIESGACDVLAWEQEDQVFDVVQDACFQVNRTYYIINWCTYEAGMEPIEISRDENAFGEVRDAKIIDFSKYGNHGYFKYTQVLKVNDSNKPIVTINPVQTCIYGIGDVPPITGEDITPGAPPYECDTIRVFSAEARDCEEAFFSNFGFEWWIYEDGLQTGHGETAKFFWTVEPKINYTVKFRVYDNCGNFGEKEENFQFWDCTQPTLICQDTLVTSIRENGLALVSPTVIADKSYDNCTPPQELDFRIWHSSYSDVAPSKAEEIQKLPNALELGCDYLDLQRVQVYLLDKEANFSSCVTNIIIDNGEFACTSSLLPRSSLAGKIIMENGVEVEEVAVQIKNTLIEEPTPYMTSTDGNYHFDLTKNQNYQIIPQKNINPLNGVTTYDLVLISKHILKIEEITSPYYQIAADVNRSGTITAFDMVQLRQLILNVTTEFDNNESWRFVDAAYVFESDNPLTEAFNEVIDVQLEDADQMNHDFIAVKIGDVNGNAVPNSLVEAESRTIVNTLPIQVKQQLVQKGQLFSVELQADDLTTIEGYQFALSFPQLDLLAMEAGTIQEQHVGWQLRDRHVLPVSWNSTDDKVPSSSLIQLTFQANQSGALSDLLSIHPALLQPEAYTIEDELLTIDLLFNSVNTAFDLSQNRPNPFKESTTIGFHLPTDDEVTLRILSMDGKVAKEWTKSFAKGYQEWTLHQRDFNLSGILHYQITTSTHTATKKMIVLE